MCRSLVLILLWINLRKVVADKTMVMNLESKLILLSDEDDISNYWKCGFAIEF